MGTDPLGNKSVPQPSEDSDLMRLALGLAARGLGATGSNPAVGCVLYRRDLGTSGRIVGRGWTQAGGRPHAETEALNRAGDLARGATAYVTLEPCAHHGKSPPCAEALIAAGVGRVVIAVPDPDPRVNGAGIKMLEKAGIEVLTGEGVIQGSGQLAGYLKRFADGRPLVTVKVATSLDGKIALHGGKSRWITGNRAREQAHLMRARHDGIMVGLGTVVADDPELTCRLPGLASRSPIRIIADSRLRTSLTTKLAASANQTPTWIIALDSAPAERKRAFADIGVEVIEIGANSDGGLDTRAALKALGDRGLQSVLVEGGGRLVASLLLARTVDRLAWFRAPKAIGGDGVPAVAALGFNSMDDAPRFHRIDIQRVGEDILETYAVQA